MLKLLIRFFHSLSLFCTPVVGALSMDIICLLGNVALLRSQCGSVGGGLDLEARASAIQTSALPSARMLSSKSAVH